jgi:hypothetical protein
LFICCFVPFLEFGDVHVRNKVVCTLISMCDE